jgi:protein tyrosine/serine phosphatase
MHCHDGKDHTNMVVALALSIAGIPKNEIITDYFLTQKQTTTWLAEQLTNKPNASLHPEMIEFRNTRAESMIAILRHLDDKYNNPKTYLRHNDLNTKNLDQLHQHLT